MVQTSYSINIPTAFQGLIADDGFHDITSYLNADVVGLSFGIGVVQGTNDDQCLLPTATTQSLLGVTVSNFAYNQFSPTNLTGTQGIPLTAAAGVMTRGRIYVLPTQDVTPASPVFCQMVANGTTKVAGSFRKDYDGTAQVTTMTPTAVNSTEYQLEVDGRFYAYTSDSTATAAEIVTGLTAAITADAGATVTPTGTTTLILTAKVPGKPFVAQGDVNMSFAATTANAFNAIPVPNARFKTTATFASGTPVVLEINLP
jgi:hypothetical protein